MPILNLCSKIILSQDNFTRSVEPLLKVAETSDNSNYSYQFFVIYHLLEQDPKAEGIISATL